MVIGGDINGKAIVDSFQKVKEDIARLNLELAQVKKENERLLADSVDLKKAISFTFSEQNIQGIIEKAVERTLASVNIRPTFNDRVIRKINRSKKLIIKNRILELASMKSATIPEIKEVIVDNEQMCSKATFYRYIDRLREKNIVSEVEIDDRKVLVR